VPVIAAVVLIGCIALTLLILRGRAGRREVEHEHDPELDEALDRMREWVRRPPVVVAGATVVALGLIFALARNPSRWAVLLLALAVLVAGVTSYLVVQRRRRDRG
jgi:amino acid transporter